MQNDAVIAHPISENKPERERERERERNVLRRARFAGAMKRDFDTARPHRGSRVMKSPRDYESKTCGIDDSIEELRTSCLEGEAIYQSRVNNV